MPQKSYTELLRDPRWQRKRLTIMERDRFVCCRCGAGHLTLNVHHTFYQKGVLPWQYPDHSLLTFCEPCHVKEEKEKEAIDRKISLYLRKLGATNMRVNRIGNLIQEISNFVGSNSALSVVENALDEAASRNNKL